MASTYLSKTITPSNYNRRKFTLSAWVKKADDSVAASPILGFHGSTDYTMIRVDASSGVEFICYQSSSVVARKQTNMKLRDFSGWYHVVVAVDTDNGTASYRNRIYVNGEEQTSFSIDTNASSGLDLINNNQTNFDIGSSVDQGGSRGYFGGILSHVHYCEGYQYSPSDFGETDATTGEWKIKTDVSVSYGTNGFFILKDGNSVTDQSGNGNNWTVAGGTLTNTEDSPSNVFATINPLVPYSSNYDFYNGNTTVENDGSAADWTTRWGVSTLGMSSGKFYAEAKVAAIGTNQMYALGLVKDVGTFTPTSSIGTDGVGYYSNGGIFNLSNQNQTVATYTTNDIIGIAFDRDNGTVQWYKNGSAVGTAETGLSTDGTWFFVTNQYTNGKVYVNYGNGYFGTTAVSSAGTNASGIGIFEYDVPTGYTALSTKGLNL